MTVNGTGFSYTQYQGIPYVNGGVVSTIDVSSGLGSFSFTNVNVDMATFSPIIISDLLESQPAAIETFLLLRDWDITLGNARDVAWSDTLVGDGVAFNPRGNDTIHAGGGNDRIFLGDGNDTAFGGRGKDKLAGGNGNDELRGEQGRTSCLAGPDSIS
ncbi:calcium-binding protein [Seohaeicola zhoushanensis]